jgi:biopolymer transport protein ExbB/TolQ
MLLWTLTSIALAADEAAPGFTLGEIWQHSGPIARGVIVMLLVMLLASLFVAIERVIAYSRARSQSMQVAASVGKLLNEGDVEKALAVTKDEAYKASYLAALLRNGLGELNTRFDRHGVDAAERAVDKAIGEELGKLRRGMTILATTGSTAPFVGLFGTTFGVINAFQGMATAGSGLASISAGISEALITTGVGIGVAVLGVWFFNYFNQRAEKVSEELRSAEADFFDWAEKELVRRDESRQAGK